ncbi:MAG: alpha/beta hydrolase [Pelagibacteraceae bacterium TMED267]|nr:MAG: alpha/beta hydrolase [Pelagibacteraceae bacterium TMED267]
MNKNCLLIFLILFSLSYLGENFVGGDKINSGESLMFESFKKDTIERLEGNSKVIKTQLGLVEYAEFGNSGPIILEIHGSPGGFDQIIETKGFKTIAPSRPGYLRTPLSSGESPENQARLFSALLDELKIDSVIVKGTSGGGPAAIEFASNFPERTQGLILFEALTGAWTPNQDPAEDIENFSDHDMWNLLSSLENSGDENMVSFLIPNKNNQKLVLNEKENIENLKKLFWSIWPLSLRLDGWKNDKNNFKNLSLPLNKIKCPTLIIHGTEDTNVDIKHAEKALKEIQNSKLYIVEGGDHYMSFSHSNEIEKEISNFIKSL